MKAVTICPCCSTPLLHHLNNNREYWFCRHCWQEMPHLESDRAKNHHQSSKVLSLSASFSNSI